MADQEERDHIETILHAASLEDLERLVKGIDRSHIIDLVKKSKHLKQHVFSGFRPTRLPWPRVPSAMAREAQDDTALLRALMGMWLATNESLIQVVQTEVSVERIEDDVTEMLISLGLGERDRLVWALLLDEREGVQDALAEGLREALISDASALTLRVKCLSLQDELREAQEKIAGLTGELERSEEQVQLLRPKASQVEDLLDEQQHRKTEILDVNAQLQETVRQRDEAREIVKAHQTELSEEKARSRELQRSVDDLKASFQAAVASRQETVGEVQQRFDDTLETLEETRKENAQLRLRIERLESDVVLAYSKRDAERDRAEEIFAKVVDRPTSGSDLMV